MFVLSGSMTNDEVMQLWYASLKWRRSSKFVLPNLVEINRIIATLKRDLANPKSTVESNSFRLTYHWTAEMDEIVGTESDDVIAEKLGRTKQAVRARRTSLGRIEKRTPWTAEDDAILGTNSDSEIGKILNLPMQTVKERRILLKIQPFESRWTPEMDALVGTDTNRNVAAKLGKTLDSVKHRARLLREKNQGDRK